MVIDYSRFENLDSDVDSDEEVHPNIDRKSWLKLRREQRRIEKQKKIARLRELEVLGDCPAIQEEKKRLIEELTPKIREAASSSATSNPVETDYTEHIFFLVGHNTIQDFNRYMEKNIFSPEELEDVVLLSLSENIKASNNDGARILSKISLYIKYAKIHGKVFMKRLEEGLRDQERMRMFEQECETHFQECRGAVLGLKSAAEQ